MASGFTQGPPAPCGEFRWGSHAAWLVGPLFTWQQYTSWRCASTQPSSVSVCGCLLVAHHRVVLRRMWGIAAEAFRSGGCVLTRATAQAARCWYVAANSLQGVVPAVGLLVTVLGSRLCPAPDVLVGGWCWHPVHTTQVVAVKTYAGRVAARRTASAHNPPEYACWGGMFGRTSGGTQTHTLPYHTEQHGLADHEAQLGALLHACTCAQECVGGYLLCRYVPAVHLAEVLQGRMQEVVLLGRRDSFVREVV